MENREAVRERLSRLAWLLDSAIRIPGFKLSVGLDAVIGLIPGLGDAVGALLSAYIVQQAARLGVPRATLIRMVINVAIEGFIGLVPLAGDVFDAVWKANMRNVALLNAHFEHPEKAAAASRTFVLALMAGLIALMMGVFAAGVLVLRWLIQVVSG